MPTLADSLSAITNTLSLPSRDSPDCSRRGSAATNRNAVHSAHIMGTKPAFVKKPRPNSLAIVSRSHDCLNVLDNSDASSKANQEVNRLTLPIRTDEASSLFSTANRSTSEDILRASTLSTGLQQRRRCRPTSLHIPSLLNIPAAQPSQTAGAYVSNQPLNR